MSKGRTVNRRLPVDAVSSCFWLDPLCHTGTVTFAPLPTTACWRHRGARTGFEVAYFQAGPDGWRIEGATTAVEDATLVYDESDPWSLTTRESPCAPNQE